MQELVFPNPRCNKLMQCVGAVIMTCSFLLLYPLLYGRFFEPRIYHNRIALYKWLMSNTLPVPDTQSKNYTHWNINGIEITLSSDNRVYTDQLCSFKCDIIDGRRYNKIRALLIKDRDRHLAK